MECLKQVRAKRSNRRSGGMDRLGFESLKGRPAGIFLEAEESMEIMNDLELNPTLEVLTLTEVVEKSTRLTFQLSSCIVFYIVYYHMSTRAISPYDVIQTCWISAVVGHSVFQLIRCWPVGFGFVEIVVVLFPKEHLRLTLVYLIASYQLAPILKTLTATISTDTIHATSVIMLSCHLLSSDYGVAGFFVSKTISVNTAVIGSICLASRLSSDHHSLALLTLAVVCLVLFPMFSNLIWDSTCILVLVVTMVSMSCFTVSLNSVIAYLIVVFFITGLAPLIFVFSQKFKYNLYGPWDEAVPRMDL